MTDNTANVDANTSPYSSKKQGLLEELGGAVSGDNGQAYKKKLAMN